MNYDQFSDTGQNVIYKIAKCLHDFHAQNMPSVYYVVSNGKTNKFNGIISDVSHASIKENPYLGLLPLGPTQIALDLGMDYDITKYKSVSDTKPFLEKLRYTKDCKHLSSFTFRWHDICYVEHGFCKRFDDWDLIMEVVEFDKWTPEQKWWLTFSCMNDYHKECVKLIGRSRPRKNLVELAKSFMRTFYDFSDFDSMMTHLSDGCPEIKELRV